MIRPDVRGWALLSRILNSPVMMSWGSIAARLLGLLVLTPLVLSRFREGDTALWLLLAIFASMQVVADAGFSQTFARAIAYAEGGASLELLKSYRPPSVVTVSHVVNADLMIRLIGTMRLVYKRLALIGAVIFSAMLPMLLHPVSRASDPVQGWFAVAVVFVVSLAVLGGNLYSAFLQGRNRIALLRRWEMLFGVAGTVSAIFAVLAGGGLLLVVCVQQAWVLLGIIRNRWLCRLDDDFRIGQSSAADMEVFRAIWPAAWRSGVGVLMSLGVTQASGLIYAQIGTSAQTASYLLALRVVQAISQFSQVPFYSKIPMLTRLYSQDKKVDMIALARRGFALSHLTFMAGFLFVGISAAWLLQFIGSKTEFVSPALWTLMGAAFLLERLGAMHIQLYSTTNHIVWHVANGWTGLAMLLLGLALYPAFKVAAFPAAMAISYGLIYCPISFFHSYKFMQIPFPDFDMTAGLFPVLIMWAAWAIYCYF